MTRSDPGDSSKDQGQANPFDTGLPMLRLPAEPTSKRRQPSARRASGAELIPEVDVPEQRPDLGPGPTPSSSELSGDWKHWLDAPSPAEEFPDSAVEHGGYPIHHADTESDRYDEPGERVPTLVDRSGGSPGPRLRHPPRRQEQTGGSRLLAALIVVGIVVAISAVVMIAVKSSGKHKPSVAATSAVSKATSAASSAVTRTSAMSSAVTRTSETTVPGERSPAFATPGCEQRRTPDVVSGTDPGGTSDGPSAILAFERAYYVQRSGSAARAVVADDAVVPLAEQIQRGINQIPIGTLYCVLITRTATGVGDGQSHWEVQLTQQHPGEQPQTFTQIITTRTAANRTLITAINAA
ncbi:hypothetical protein [Nocardia sp. NPDC051463]|uniref:hypothetical protein n=1 Tax=Nocardia sp. NPDC051463 TaxID=3154845 RepID=UPI003439BB27